MRAAYEPTDEECEWKPDEEEELTVSKQVQVIHTCMLFKYHLIYIILYSMLFSHSLTPCIGLCPHQEEMKEKAKVEEEKKDEEKEDPKGIPEFWLTVFKNVDLLSEMLQVGRERRAREGAVVSVVVFKSRSCIMGIYSLWKMSLLPSCGAKRHLASSLAEDKGIVKLYALTLMMQPFSFTQN